MAVNGKEREWTKEEIYAVKLATLRSHDYKRVWVDGEGRLAVEVHISSFDPEMHSLYRRVWGYEWPIVRSAKWVHGGKMTPDTQLTFSSTQ